MPRVQNPGGSLPSTTTILTAAQISTMHTTPVQLVAAPGANKVIAVLGMQLVFKPGTSTFQSVGSIDAMHAYYSSLVQPVLDDVALSGIVTGATWYFANPQLPVGNLFLTLPGVDNNSVVLTSDEDYNRGSITGLAVNNGGAGYAVNDVGTISGGGNGDGNYKVTSVAAGVVTGITANSLPNGTGYSVANGVTTTRVTGVGVGLTINITSIQIGNGTLKAILYYQIIANTVP